MDEPQTIVAKKNSALSPSEVSALIAQVCPAQDYNNKRILLIVPDGTRTAPVGLLFQALHRQIGQVTKALDVLIALGTHQPMSEEAICHRLDISEQQRREAYNKVKFFNHTWNNPATLKQVGTLSAEEVSQLTGGLFSMDPEAAWDKASDLSRQIHITYKDKPFHTIVSCAPPMYDELWTAGKCMYKLEPVLADDGELIIYAPHLNEVCVSHGGHIEEIGYHCRDYFLKQWDKFKHVPWGVLAHSTHVRGIGTFENGVERCRAAVTLATQIAPATCERINLGYRDPETIRLEDFADREDEGVLLVPKAGEMLFHLKHQPQWAGGNGE